MAAALKHVINLSGTPKHIVFDGDREFMGEYKSFGISPETPTLYRQK